MPSDRDLAIARAALEAAADEAQFEHACETYHELCDCRTLIGKAIRALDPAAIVAGVPPRHKAERVMDELNHHALDENQRLRARVAELTDKAIRFDLDQAGIELREKEAVELVELRAKVAELEPDAARYRRLRDRINAATPQIARAVEAAAQHILMLGDDAASKGYIDLRDPFSDFAEIARALNAAAIVAGVGRK